MNTALSQSSLPTPADVSAVHAQPVIARPVANRRRRHADELRALLRASAGLRLSAQDTVSTASPVSLP